MDRNRIERGWFGLSAFLFKGVAGDYFFAEKIGADSDRRVGLGTKSSRLKLNLSSFAKRGPWVGTMVVSEGTANLRLGGNSRTGHAGKYKFGPWVGRKAERG